MSHSKKTNAGHVGLEKHLPTSLNATSRKAEYNRNHKFESLHKQIKKRRLIMEIAYDKHNINKVFSSTHFHIDFYQREYKWDKDTVTRLIDDIFYRFDSAYSEYRNLTANQENVENKYPWYFMNTYITNKSGKTYIVDGQQRLTTLSLILISLYHLCDKHNLSKQQDWLRIKIAGVGPGGEKQYWLGHERRIEIMQTLFEQSEPDGNLIDRDITAKNMFENYKTIDREFHKRLETKQKLDTFIYYFLLRIVLINLEVDQRNVPMVFEVINDRGIRLNPYEILKGKLLGILEKEEVHQYADIWEKHLDTLETNGMVDVFFRTYFRAKFSRTRAESRDFDGAYHRTIDEDKYNNILKLKHNASGVKAFLDNDFTYYSSLFQKINNMTALNETNHLYFNSELNRMEGQAMLILAACKLNDPDENNKIKTIARLFDKTYVLLQLNKLYDSNQFQDLLYTLLGKIEKEPVDKLEPIFDSTVLSYMNKKRGSSGTTLLSYEQFKQVGYADYNTRFLRYFLTRIELFISQETTLQLQDTLYNFVSGAGKFNAYHIEHILSRNSDNKSLFVNSENNFDQMMFERERNRLGGLLLLKGRDNQSSGNEKYCDKLKTYTGCAPYLAQSLVKDFYKSNSCMTDFITNSELQFKAIDNFDRKVLEERSALLFNIVEKIWGPIS
ncbi:MAG: DUF262 domain-containing protein [Alkaliphilus sp.]